MSSKYAKQKSKSLRTFDIRYENIPGREQMQKSAMFQYHFPHIVVNTVLGPASGLIPIW